MSANNTQLNHLASPLVLLGLIPAVILLVLELLPWSNVESASRSTVAVAQGGYMSNNIFVTTRGDRMSGPLFPNALSELLSPQR